jgi:Tfp pilus assembly protein FimT
LIELLVVVAIIALMLSLLLPALSGWGSSAGRRGAVTMVMNTLEQARVAALESGQTVYVGFAPAEFPDPDMRYSGLIVFREVTEEEAAQGKDYVVLKPWTRLPKNVAFKRVDSSLVPTGSTANQSFPGLASQLGAAHGSVTSFPVVSFNSSGAVEGGSSPIQLFLYEGYFANGQDNFTRKADQQSSSAGLFEKITISRFTGRVQLDVTGT